MWLLCALSLLAARCASATSVSTSICTPAQCTTGNANAVTAITGSVSSGSSDLLLLPGQYTSTSGTNVVNILAAGQAPLVLPPYLLGSSGATVSLPLTLSVQAGIVVFPSPLFQGQPTFSPLLTNTTTTASNQTQQIGSFLISDNAYAVLQGSGSNPIIVWDVTPDMGQMPTGLLNGSGGTTLVDIQSTTCSTPCSTSGRCNSKGQCVCKAGFTGSSCEACATGFYGPQCLPCPNGCATCDDSLTGTGKCLSSTGNNSPASCNCANGSCSGSGNTTCTCLAGYATSGSAIQCSDCASGFFKDSTGACTACSQNCQECSSPLGKCTACKSNFTADVADPTHCNANPSTCAIGTFPAGVANCLPCSALCKTCTGPNDTDCGACSAGSADLGGQCVATNQDGICVGSALVANTAKGTCDSCPKNCASCSIPNFSPTSSFSLVQCTTCLSGFVLSNGTCLEQCPPDQFVGGDGFTCQACDSSCATCAGSSTFCLTCSQNGQFALNGKCTASCPASTFSLATAVTSNNTTTSNSPTTGGICSPCHPDCATCTGSRFDQCASCPPERPVHSATGRCLQACSRGSYWDNPTGSCVQCASGCATCSGAGADTCLSCASGMSLTAGKCGVPTCSATGAVDALGSVCLSTLLSVSVTSTSTNPTGKTPKSIWPFILGAALFLLLIAIGVFLWRRHARKARAADTKVFKERLERDGINAARRGTKFLSRLFGSGDVDTDKDRAGDAEKRRTNLRAKLRMSRNPIAFGMVDLENKGTTKPKFKVSPRPMALSLERPTKRGESVDSDTDEEDRVPETPFRRPTHKYMDSTDIILPQSRPAAPEDRRTETPSRRPTNRSMDSTETASSRRRPAERDFSRDTLLHMLGQLEQKPEPRAGSSASAYSIPSSSVPLPPLPVPRQPLKDSEFDPSLMQGARAHAFDSRYPPPPKDTQPLIDLRNSKYPFNVTAAPAVNSFGASSPWKIPSTLPAASTGSQAWQTANVTGTSAAAKVLDWQKESPPWQTPIPTGSTVSAVSTRLFQSTTLPPGTVGWQVPVPTGTSSASGYSTKSNNPFLKQKQNRI